MVLNFKIPLVIKEKKIKYFIIMFNSEICKLENDLHKLFKISLLIFQNYNYKIKH